MFGTILIADDDPSFVTILQTYLEGKGLQTLAAADGLAAAMRVFDHKPQLVILDIKMPGPYGISVYESLQNDPETSRIPVIFVSALIDEETLRRRVPASPLTRFLGKPVDLARLHAAITEMLAEAGRRG